MKAKRFLPDGLAVCAALTALLALGAGAFAFHQDFSFWEKRYLADTPKNLSLLDWTLNRDLESFLSDHLPLRRLFVSLDAWAQMLTGRATQMEAWPVGNSIVEKPVRADDDALLARVRAMREIAGDIPCRFLIPPTAGMLNLADMSPARRAVYAQEQALYDRLSQTPGFIPLLSVFEESREPVYYRTDHHWNFQGTYAAYRAYCRAAGLTPLPTDAFEILSCGSFLGSTASRSGLLFARQDELICPDSKAPVTLRFDGETYDHLIFPEQSETYDGYSVFLKGNHGMMTVDNPAGEKGTLFLCKDSYANSIIPFLSAHYRRIVAVDARYYAGSFAQALEEAGDTEEILFLYSLDSLANDTALIRKLNAR